MNPEVSVVVAAVCWVCLSLPVAQFPSIYAPVVLLFAIAVITSMLFDFIYAHSNKEIHQYFRSEAASSVWCCLLFPMCQLTDEQHSGITGGLERAISGILQLLVSLWYLSGLFHHCTFCIRPSTVFLTNFLTLSATVVTLILLRQLDHGCLTMLVIMEIIHYHILQRLPKLLPQTFTLGEHLLVSQLIAYFGTHAFAVTMKFHPEIEHQPDEVTFISVVISVEILITGFVHSYRVFQSPLGFYFIYCGGAIIVLAFLHFRLSRNPCLWLMVYIFNNEKRTLLFGYWVICGMAAVLLVAKQYNSDVQGRISTVVRKYFHVLLIAVYIPGLLFDPKFLSTAAFGALVLLLVLEHMRVYMVPPLGKLVQDSFHIFIDKQDSGIIIITHIYLLLGCSCPIWLQEKSLFRGASASAYAGIISLGVGDAAASIGGTLCGQHRWPGTRKTIEGTMFSIVTQWAAYAFMAYQGIIGLNMVPVIVAILTSLLEAFTSQIDNLILPFFTYFLLNTLHRGQL